MRGALSLSVSLLSNLIPICSWAFPCIFPSKSGRVIFRNIAATFKPLVIFSVYLIFSVPYFLDPEFFQIYSIVVKRSPSHMFITVHHQFEKLLVGN